MKKILLIFALPLLSCLPESIRPPYLPNQVVVDSAIVGAWAIGAPDSIDALVEVRFLDSASYLISCKDFSYHGKDTARFNYEGHLTTIDKQTILSLTFPPDDIKDTTSLTRALHIPGYFFARITKRSKDSIQFDLFDFNKLSREIGNSSFPIRYLSNGDTKLITDEPLKVRQFLSKCMKEKDFFDTDPAIYWRLRKK